MASFQYTALGSPKSQFRLVRLLPRNPPLQDCRQSGEGSSAVKHQNTESELIRCTMEEISLSQLPAYTAMSYAWGDDTLSHRIFVNGAYFRVTESLDVMLRHIQRETETMTLWIDQLCINQRDEAEKGDQLPLMKIIYRSAINAIIWIGPSANDSDLAMKFLADVGEEAHKLGLMKLKLRELQNWSAEAESDERRTAKEFLDRLLERVGATFPVKAFGDLITRPWFFRVWVVQELSLAKDVLFRCGMKEISYEHFHAAKYLYTVFVGLWLGKLRSSEIMSLGEIRQKILAIREVNTRPVTLMLNARRKYQAQGDDVGEALYVLLKNLHVTSTRGIRLQAKNHRDLIYGLLGLASDANELNIQPDYKKSSAEVFTDVARKLIKQGHLDVLELSQFPKSSAFENAVHALPSWVPDWSGKICKPCGDLSVTIAPFTASGSSKVSTFEAGSAVGVLALEGVRVDEVERVGAVWQPSLGGQFPIADAKVLFDDIARFCQESMARDNDIYKNSERQKESVWRTPIGDKELGDDGITILRATMKSERGYDRLAKKVAAEPLLGPEYPVSWFLYAYLTVFVFAQRILTYFTGSELYSNLRDSNEESYIAMMGDMQNRRPFLTRKGYIGQGPAIMQPGDLICVPFGAKVPYVLRPEEECGYTFVGESYCDGIMDGEFMQFVTDGISTKETFKIS